MEKVGRFETDEEPEKEVADIIGDFGRDAPGTVFKVFAKTKGATDEHLSYYVIQTEKHTQRTCTSTRFFRKKPGKKKFWCRMPRARKP